MWNFRKTLTSITKERFSSLMALTALATLLCTNSVIAYDEDETTIKVHGNWAVTVTNPDGSIAQERSFKNALVADGKKLLVRTLANSARWSGDFGNSPGWGILALTVGVDPTPDCKRYTSGDFETFQSGIEAEVSDSSNTSITISRTMTLPLECVFGETYNITNVNSHYAAVFRSSIGMEAVARGNFSEKALESPILGVFPDQVVTLKVTFSFE